MNPDVDLLLGKYKESDLIGSWRNEDEHVEQIASRLPFSNWPEVLLVKALHIYNERHPFRANGHQIYARMIPGCERYLVSASA